MINFPGLNLSFNVKKIAFSICGIDVYHYAICIVSGIILAMFLSYKSKEKFGIKFEFLLESMMHAIIIGFIGARIYYVTFNYKKYITSPISILNLRDGGLAVYGGLIFGAIVIINRCKKNSINFLDFFDYIAPFISLAQSIGRWGNFFNVEAYGTETTNIFRMGINTLNGYQEVHPAFLYESISTLVIFIVLRISQKNRKFKGEISYLYLFFYSGIRMLIEGVRIDSLRVKNFRISQILSVAIFVVSGIMLLKNYIKYISRNIQGRKWGKKSIKN